MAEENNKSNFYGIILLALVILFMIGSTTANLAYLDTENTVVNVRTNGSDTVVVETNNTVVDVNYLSKDVFTGDLFFGEELSLLSNLSIPTVEDNYSFTVDNVGAPFTVGQYVYLASNITGRVFGGRVVSVTGNDIEMDTPINTVYNPNSTLIIQQNIEMNVDGSTTRRIFAIANPTNIPITLDITRILFHMECSNAPEFSRFCDIVGGLTYGLAVRTANGVTSNLFNVKTNGELAALMYDVNIYDQATPPGVYGIGGRLSYGGESKHGAIIRLEPGEQLQAIIQDDLSTLQTFRMMASFRLYVP